MDSAGVDRDGRIPFRLRIGVTGHRTLPDEETLAKSVASVIDRIRELVPGPRLAPKSKTPVELTVVSPLAEGADRLVARAVLDEPGADLEAPLPLEPDDYKHDFETQMSKDEFDRLRKCATTSPVAPRAPAGNEAYELVGRYVVNRCDVLIAMWDREPGRGRGGTAEIVAYADRHGVPTFIIDLNTGDVSEHLGAEGSRLESVRQEWRRVDGYNWARVPPNAFARAADDSNDELTATSLAAGLVPSAARRVAEWLAPYTARTGLLAASCQRMYLRLTAAVFLLAALAVITVTLQVLFWPDVPEIVIVELVMLAALLAIVVFGRWRKINRRFICDRFLAERLREAPYLVLADRDRPRGSGFKRSYLGHQPEGWPWRAFAEMWNRRPRGDVVATDVSKLRDVVAETWIAGQLGYHQRAAAKNRRLHDLFFGGSIALLSVTILAAALHAAGVGGHDTDGLTWPNVLVLLSIALPALGGALTGIAAQREYARHAERSERMVEYLREAQGDVRAAEGLDAVRDATQETEDLMLAENRDWFGVLSFRDLEPHS